MSLFRTTHGAAWTVIIAVSALLACNGAPKAAIGHIETHSELSMAEVEFAILAALAATRPPDRVSPNLALTQHQVDAWFASPYAGARASGGLWSI
jgi:hypothetical protein